MKYNFKIRGIDCANCAANLERELQKVDGVMNAAISFMSERLIIECDELIKDDVMKRVKKVIKKEEPEAIVEEV